MVHEDIVAATGSIFALVFTVGVRLAAPIVVVLLIVELALGLISRTAPSLTTMVVGAPVRLLVGLAILATMIAIVPGVVSSALERVLTIALETAGAFR